MSLKGDPPAPAEKLEKKLSEEEEKLEMNRVLKEWKVKLEEENS